MVIGKSEYIFSLLISISMVAVAIKLLIDAVNSLIFKNELTYSIYLVIVCIVTIITKMGLFVYVNKLNKKFNNILLKANAKDHFNDCIVTSFTLISILFASNGIYWIDGLVGIGIAIYIFYTGITIFVESYNVLMDVSIDENTKDVILNLIHNYKDIKNIENLYSTPSGYKYIITLTIFVDGNMSTFDSHCLADNLEHDIKALDNISDVIIHVNPI
ncbi:MAG: cation diffusion facilitator family transporter [Clostridia bacterium]|nr:cation diffusion facilitator family transporter [Clostridia bacterium]